MPFKSPPQIASAGIETGARKAALPWDKALVAGFLAGAYVAFAGMVADRRGAAGAAQSDRRHEGARGERLADLPACGRLQLVANMFFLPAAIFADVPGLDWGDALHNWLFAFLGNFAGAFIFVTLSYWYLYVRD